MDLSKLGRTEQALSAAGLLAFIFSFLPWYSVTVNGLGSFSWNAWGDFSGFIDWFPILLLFVYGIILFLPAVGTPVNVPLLASAANRAFIGLVLAAFGVLLWAIQGLTYPSVGGLGGAPDEGSAGPAWAYFVVLVIGLAAGVRSYLGFTRAGGSLAQVGAAFRARTQAMQQQSGQPYGAADPQAPVQPQPPYGVPPQQPYDQTPPQPPTGS